MNSTFNILFFIKKNEPKKNGLATIMVRVTIDGKQIQFSSKLEIEPVYWNQKSNKVNSQSEKAKLINDELNRIRTKIYVYYTQFAQGNNLQASLQRIKKAFLNKEDETLLSYQFKERVKLFKSKSGKPIQNVTLNIYDLTFSRFSYFLMKNCNTSDIQIHHIDLPLIENFYFFLRSEYECCNNTAIKYMKRLGSVLNFAEKTGVLQNNPFHFYRYYIDKNTPIYLTKEEVDIIWAKRFSVYRLEFIRDIFIFSCYTGVSFSDIVTLKKSDIHIGNDNKLWLYFIRKKTDTKCYIPLLEIPLQIISKYSNNDTKRLFPLANNQKANEYLKEIADLCGIRKKITFHVSRHTFATLALDYSVSIEAVSSMLGHTDIKSTQRYSHITRRKIEKEVMQFRNVNSSSDDNARKSIVLDIALKLKNVEIPISVIAECTGLCVDEIINL